MRLSSYTLIIILLFSLSTFLGAQTKPSPQNWDQALVKLSQDIIEFGNKKGKFRLAMLPLAATTGGKQSNDFGKYFTDQLSGRLIQNKNLSFKIFERKQLEVILEEHALSSSSVISQKDAVKLGELAPVDVLFTGSYTKLKSYIAVHISLLDVLSGEILLALNTDINLTQDLQELFKQVTISDKNIFKPQVKICQEKKEKILSLLNDLTSDEKISTLINTASETELFSPCGELHLEVMRTFLKHKIVQKNYQRFLSSQLSQIQYIANRESMRATLLALDYLSADGLLDDKEFQLGLNLTAKLAINYYYDYYFKTLIDTPHYKPVFLKEAKKRIDSIFEQVQNKIIGLPLPINIDQAYLEMLEALEPYRYTDPIDSELFLYTVEQYQDKIQAETRFKSFSDIMSALRKEKDSGREKTFLRLLSIYFSLQSPGEELGKQFLQLHYWATQNNKINLLNPIIAKSPKIIEQSLLKMRYQNQERLKTCLEFQLSCPGLIPDMKTILRDLRSTQIQKQLEACDTLIALETKAKTAESRLIKIIEYIMQKRIKDKNAPQLLSKVIQVLGNISSQNPKTFKYLSLYLFDPKLPYGTDSTVNHTASQALLKIGPKALPQLLARLKDSQSEIKIAVLKVIGTYGRGAKNIQKKLKQLQTNEKDDFIKDRYQDTIENID